MKVIYNSTDASSIFFRACHRLRESAFETACLISSTAYDVPAELLDVWVELCDTARDFWFPDSADERDLAILRRKSGRVVDLAKKVAKNVPAARKYVKQATDAVRILARIYIDENGLEIVD